MNAHQTRENRPSSDVWRPRVVALLLLLLSSFTVLQAQLNVVYVDASNGSDSFTGANPTDSITGQGPKATIHAGLSALANNGRLIIVAGQYAGDGVDTDGAPSNNTDDADIAISPVRYPRLTTGLTIELRALGSNMEIKIINEANSVRSPSGALITHSADQYIPNFIFDIPGGLLTVTSTNGTELLSLAARHSLGSQVAGLFLEHGTVDIERSSSFRLSNGATITLRGASRFARGAPQKENDLNVTYLGDESFIAGAESSYPSFGAGVVNVAKSAGSTVTFHSPMMFSGNQDAIQIHSGNAIFNGSITLGIVGDQNSLPRTADIIVESSGIVTFAAPLTLVVGTTVADSSISSIVNKGTGTVTFQKKISWYGSGNSADVIFPSSDSTSLVENRSSGSVSFLSGILLSHSSASGNAPASVEVAVVNSGMGKLAFGMPAEVAPRSVGSGGEFQQFSLAALNTGGGTLEISGAIRSRLVNATSGSLVGTVNITGATSIGSLGSSHGVLSNAQNGVINLGSNNLTLLGSATHAVVGSYITSTTGTLIIAAAGPVVIDGGTFPNVSIQQPPGGSTSLTMAASLTSLGVKSGEFRTHSALSVGGLIDVSGGVLTLEDGPGLVYHAGSFRQTGGTARIGGDLVHELNIQGDFRLSSGECRIRTSMHIASSMEVSGGTFILEGAPQRVLLVGHIRQSGGTVTIGGSTGGDLKVLGDFARTDGSFNHGSGSNLIFAGAAAQVFLCGPALQLSSLVIENAGGVVTIAEPVRVAANLTIAAGTRVELGFSTIVLNGGKGIFTNNGSFSASGLGVVMGGSRSIPGGAALGESEIRAGSGSQFSSFTVDVGAGNVCAFKSSGAVRWNGVLSVLSGSLDLASPFELAPGGTSSRLVIDVVGSNGITESVGVYNSSKTRHTVRLMGNLHGTYTLPAHIVSFLSSADSLQIDVDSDTRDNDANLATGQLDYLQLPAAGFEFDGSLLVGPRSAVRLAGDAKGGNLIKLTGESAVHRVRGILLTEDSGDLIEIQGVSPQLFGALLPSDRAYVGNLAVASSSLCRISGIRRFLGSFTSVQGSAVSLAMGDSAKDQVIGGALVINGSSFRLERNIEVQGGVMFNSGSLDFGNSDLQLTSSGDFFQASSVSGYASTGGSLVMNKKGAQLRIGDTEALGLQNLKILADTWLSAPGRVTRSLTIGSAESNGIPTLYLGQAGNDLFFTGGTISLLSNGTGNTNAIVSDGTTHGIPGGRLFITGTSVTLIMNGDFTAEEITYNPPAINGTLSILSTDLTPRVLTISDIFMHAGGQIGLGFNHLAFSGTGLQPGFRSYNRSDGTVGASSGEFRFVGQGAQQFSCGPGFSVPNLRIWNASGVTMSPGLDPIIVTKTLDLSEGKFVFDAGRVILEAGGTIVRRRSSATTSSTVSFRSFANVSYLVDANNGNLVMGTELPTEPTETRMLRICNAGNAPDLSEVQLSRDLHVSETLLLEGGTLNLGKSSLTLAPGGTLVSNGGRIRNPSEGFGRFVVSSYKLIYAKTGIVNAISPEFQSGANVAVTRLEVLGSSAENPTIVKLYANRSVGSLFVDAPGGGIEFGAPGSFVARNLTIRDSLTVRAGAITNTSGSNAIVSLAGTAGQVISLPDSGFSFSGGASAVHLLLNNRAGFVLRGGDLKFNTGSIVFFVNGVFDAGENAVILSRTVTSQGFDHQGVAATSTSHIVGRVRQSVTGGAGGAEDYPNGRYEFPTGSATDYRPVAVSFTNSYPAKNPGEIEISHINRPPQGTKGLPLDGGMSSWIGNTSPFSWRVDAFPSSLLADQKFDLEVSAKNPGAAITIPADVRILRRDEPDSDGMPWNLLGPGSGYGTNSLVVGSTGDTLLQVRVNGTQGLSGHALIALGLPSERKPYLNFRVPATLSEIPFGSPMTFSVSVSDPDGRPLTIIWKVNGKTIKAGGDTSLTQVFQSSLGLQSVRALFLNTQGLSDSTEWTFLIVSVEGTVNSSPALFRLHQNFPNPFNPSTTISFDLPSASLVTLKIYDLLGKEVAALVSDRLRAGSHAVKWTPGRMPSGVYFCHLVAVSLDPGQERSFTASRQMILAK